MCRSSDGTDRRFGGKRMFGSAECQFQSAPSVSRRSEPTLRRRSRSWCEAVRPRPDRPPACGRSVVLAESKDGRAELDLQGARGAHARLVRRGCPSRPSGRPIASRHHHTAEGRGETGGCRGRQDSSCMVGYLRIGGVPPNVGRFLHAAKLCGDRRRGDGTASRLGRRQSRLLRFAFDGDRHSTGSIRSRPAARLGLPFTSGDSQQAVCLAVVLVKTRSARAWPGGSTLQPMTRQSDSGSPSRRRGTSGRPFEVPNPFASRLEEMGSSIAALYPDVVEAGSVAAAMHRTLSAQGSDLPIDRLFYGAESATFASAAHGDRGAQVYTAAKERLFLFDLWEKEIQLAKGATSELTALATVVRAWIEDRPKASELARRVEFVQMTEYALSYEQGTYLEAVWRRFLTPESRRDTNRVFHWDELQRIIGLAHERPELRRLLPYRSLWRFCNEPVTTAR